MKIKEAVGKYSGVKSISENEAIDLARKFFLEPGSKRWEKSEKLRTDLYELRKKAKRIWKEGRKLREDGENFIGQSIGELDAKGYIICAEGDKMVAEGEMLWAECEKMWAEHYRIRLEIAIENEASLRSYRYLNMIANVRHDSVYSFIFSRKEVWVYSRDRNPDPNKVEKVEWR